MKKILYVLFFVMVILLSACGESADMECIKNAARDGIENAVASTDYSLFASDAYAKVLSVTYNSIEDIGRNQYKVKGAFVELVQSQRTSSTKYGYAYELVVTFNPKTETYIATDVERVSSGSPIS